MCTPSLGWALASALNKIVNMVCEIKVAHHIFCAVLDFFNRQFKNNMIKYKYKGGKENVIRIRRQ